MICAVYGQLLCNVHLIKNNPQHYNNKRFMCNHIDQYNIFEGECIFMDEFKIFSIRLCSDCIDKMTAAQIKQLLW